MAQSINQELAKYPVQRAWAHDVKGRVLLMPRTGLVVVPHSDTNTGWNCVVVRGNGTYPVGGHDVYVSNREILRGVEVPAWIIGQLAERAAAHAMAQGTVVKEER